MTTEKTSGGVYAKIAAVQSALAKTGIAKSRKNQQQGYAFRGIDEVYGALAPLLAEHGLCIMPRMVGRHVVERQSQKGGALFNVTVEAEFDFVSAADGSFHTVRTYGEAMDSADKATNKAMSAAYKYAALMTFAIPTEGDNDADAVTHDVAPRPREEVSTHPFPAGPAKNITDLKSMTRSIWREIEGCGDNDQLNAFLDMPETRAVIKQLGELEDPNHRQIWEGDGKDNPGVAGLINRKKTEFANHIADIARA